MTDGERLEDLLKKLRRRTWEAKQGAIQVHQILLGRNDVELICKCLDAMGAMMRPLAEGKVFYTSRPDDTELKPYRLEMFDGLRVVELPWQCEPMVI